MSAVTLLRDAPTTALWVFSLIILALAVLLSYFEDHNPTKYDR